MGLVHISFALTLIGIQSTGLEHAGVALRNDRSVLQISYVLLGFEFGVIVDSLLPFLRQVMYRRFARPALV